MIKLVAFDWNGTLLSDTALAWQAGNRTFKIYGIKPISLTGFKRTFTIPIKDYWKANGLKKKIDFLKQSRIYHGFYEKMAEKARTRTGSREVLEWLKTQKTKKVIYSNHLISEITKHLVRLNVSDFFDEILARPDGDHSQLHFRSKDQKLFQYIHQHKIKPQEVITIGDTEEEIEIGKKFGFYTVALTGGWNGTQRLKKHKPDFLIHNMQGLIKIIKSINANLR